MVAVTPCSEQYIMVSQAKTLAAKVATAATADIQLHLFFGSMAAMETIGKAEFQFLRYGTTRNIL